MGDEGDTVFSGEIKGQGERRSDGECPAVTPDGLRNIKVVGSCIRQGGGGGYLLPGQGQEVERWRAQSARAWAQA
jgi:hypothetical protein